MEKGGKVTWSPSEHMMMEYLTLLEEFGDRAGPEESPLAVRCIVMVRTWWIGADHRGEGHTMSVPGEVCVHQFYSSALGPDFMRSEFARLGAHFVTRVDPQTAHVLAGEMIERFHPHFQGYFLFDEPIGFDTDIGVTFAALLDRVDDAGLVDLLKQPRCVSQAEYMVLKELGRRRKATFRNVWEFVEHAQKHEPAIDLRSPPRRPEWPLKAGSRLRAGDDK
jgi:hypothetical protein